MYAALPAILRQGDLTMLSTLHRRMGDETELQLSPAATPQSMRSGLGAASSEAAPL